MYSHVSTHLQTHALTKTIDGCCAWIDFRVVTGMCFICVYVYVWFFLWANFTILKNDKQHNQVTTSRRNLKDQFSREKNSQCLERYFVIKFSPVKHFKVTMFPMHVGDRSQKPSLTEDTCVDEGTFWRTIGHNYVFGSVNSKLIATLFLENSLKR